MTTRDEVLAMAREAARDALSEYTQQDDYLLAHGASLLSEESHEIFHIDALHRAVDAAVALAVAPYKERGVPVSVSLLRTAKDYIESASTPALLTEQRAYEWRRSRDVFVAEIDQAIDRARSAK